QRLDRVVWINPTGTPQWTNDFILNTSSDYSFPIRLVRATRTSIVLQFTGAVASDESDLNSLVAVKKVGNACVRSDAPLPARENVGSSSAENQISDKKGFFTLQAVGGPYETSATSVTIRRYSQ